MTLTEMEDHATLIVRLFEASRDRYSEDRDHPLIGPIIDQASARYSELKGRYDFRQANLISMAEAVRAVLATSTQSTIT